jgi:hypothetical protein
MSNASLSMARDAVLETGLGRVRANSHKGKP